MPEFVYVSYIRLTPELLYRALTERAFMERYWGVVVESDWQPLVMSSLKSLLETGETQPATA